MNFLSKFLIQFIIYVTFQLCFKYEITVRVLSKHNYIQHTTYLCGKRFNEIWKCIKYMLWVIGYPVYVLHYCHKKVYISSDSLLINYGFVKRFEFPCEAAFANWFI